MADTLLFDGDCGFCSSSARWAQRVAPAVDVRPYQRSDLDALALTADECAAALRWVGNGGPAAGAAAVARLLVVAGGMWRLMGWFLLLPGVRALAALLYRAVAANRYRLPGGTPACRLHVVPGQLAPSEADAGAAGLPVADVDRAPFRPD